MENRYLEFIQKFLSESPVMIPEPTSIEPSYKADPTVKVMIFDIYGTIMISASGDIEESDISARNLEQSLHAAGIQMTVPVSGRNEILLEMLESFRDEIEGVHERDRGPDKPYPEVDILKIWDTILDRQRERKNLTIRDAMCIKCFTFVFETLSNTIYPMPGMKEVIYRLSAKGMPLGIISNAQFYTPGILNFFLNGTITDDVNVPPFDPEITVFSFRHQRAKPDPWLFEIVRKQCTDKYGISPSEILFLGNDMFRDIYPAHLAGFKTALFAGDSRSLRLRKEKAEVDHIAPDYIITGLDQLLKIIV
jgi:putative hydrolase of the HAD superfamily